jgi:antirestriction protein
MRIYVACLASYNNGVLHGRWIDATTDADEMQEQINAMLRESKFPNVTVEHPETGKDVPSAEEWAVHDYDGAWPSFGEYPGLQTIADYMELVELGEERDLSPDVVKEVVDHFGRDYLDAAKEAIEENYSGCFDDLASYAQQLTEDTTDMSKIPESIRNYIDYEAMARDMKLGGDVFVIEEGYNKVHVFWNH